MGENKANFIIEISFSFLDLLNSSQFLLFILECSIKRFYKTKTKLIQFCILITSMLNHFTQELNQLA